MNLSVHNHFDIELRDAKTGNIKQKCTAYNMVLDNLYNKWCNLSTASSNKVSVLAVTSNTTPLTPSGTTAPSPYWTISLTLSNGSYDGTTCTLTKTGTATFSESSANGDLTAVMTGQNYSNLFTYAQFTDSEGSPITITKTSSDTLTITVTMYVTFRYDYQNSPLQLLPSNYYGGTIYPQENGDLSKQIPAFLSRVGIGTFGSTYSCLSTLSKYVPMSNDVYRAPSYFGGYNVVSRTDNRYTTRRILSTEFNSNITYQIRGLVFGCFSYDQSSTYDSWYRFTEFISLPNHAVYIPKQITITKSGDGVTTDFNLGVPLLMTTNVEISINDVVQSPSSYTFNGKDYTFYQAWESGDSAYVSEITDSGTASSNSYTYLTNFPYIGNGYYCTYYKKCYYDFKQSITVSRVKGCSEFTGRTDKLWYSDDNTNWTQVTQWNSSTSDLRLDPPIQARYWGITDMGTSLRDSRYGSGEVSTAFGDPKPQLHFNTAPPAGSTITVKAYTEYPIKNSNWIIEPMTLDFNIQRGS